LKVIARKILKQLNWIGCSPELFFFYLIVNRQYFVTISMNSWAFRIWNTLIW